MSFSKWIARRGGPGSAARWAAKSYRTMRTGHPGWNAVSDIDIFRLIVASRYAIFPSPRAQAFLEEWLKDEDQGLESVVVGILMAENRLDPFDFPQVFTEVVREELEKSGLSESVIYGTRLTSNKSAASQVTETITVLIAAGDEGLTRCYTDAAQSVLPSRARLNAVNPATAHDRDLWALAKQHEWSLAIVQINNIRYSSYTDSRDSLQEDSVKFVREMVSEFGKPIICCYPSSSWVTEDYLKRLLEAGARGLVQVPCASEVIRETIKQCLLFK